MSIIIKPNINNINGSSKGFPPGDVFNIVAKRSILEIRLTWEEPEDSIYQNTTLSKWGKTYLVRKTEGFPNDIKDGVLLLENTEKNKYKDTPFSDKNDIVANTIYYYRFFTESIDGAINTSSDQVVSIMATNISTVLEENTWGLISQVSEEGNASKYWNIGDTKTIFIGGQFQEYITMQIWGFNKDPKPDGGVAGITFGGEHLTVYGIPMASSYTENCSVYKWVSYGCVVRRTLNENMYNSMPDDLKPFLKKIRTWSYGYDYHESSSSDDYIWIPDSSDIPYMGNYPIFTDANSKRRRRGKNGEFQGYFLRGQPMDTGMSEIINIFGAKDTAICSNPLGALICFCI